MPNQVKVGDLITGGQAPDFEALDGEGARHALSDYQGKPVVLYFYPKDHTSGCTKEACDFRDTRRSFAKKGAVILGVSPDSAKSHESFRKKFKLPFPLLVDEDKAICKAYGVWKEKTMYGRKYFGVERSSFLIGPDGRIQALWRKVSVPGHVQQIMESL